MTCYLLRFLIFSLLIVPIAINAQQFEFVKSVDLKLNNETIIYTANDLVVSGPQYGNKIIYSLTGQSVNPDEFSIAMSDHSMPLKVAKRTPNGEKYGLIGRKGQYLIPCEYDAINSWEFGYTIAKKDKILFMVDTSGNVFPLGDEVQSARIVMTGIAACKNKYGKYGLKDKKGTLIVDYKYKDISIVSNLEKEDFGVALVHDSNHNLGLIDGEGNLVLPFSNENSYKATKSHLFIGKAKEWHSEP
ncbi:MAG: WG repeat-containing protein [Saprospiraceae bacterium]|nr:WG repeat-containing protein [Saprospiraceae bacterium]